ncbi:Uncharacterised protein [Mycobacterium tuberculosis]|nr:Uncharacterised protein [Mycobacterium tuberculosis]
MDERDYRGRRTQNPERGRKLDAESHRVREVQQSSDPKPREGTETCIRKVRTLETLPTCRQTQNPERGRKREEPSHLGLPPAGRQTQNPERGRKPDGTELSGFYQVVVRPKTPRGDGNPTMASKSAWVTDPGRQTQNPERGRKPSWWDMDERDYRGRRTQNPERGRKLDAESHRVREVQQSSDPKPREGTETHRR